MPNPMRDRLALLEEYLGTGAQGLRSEGAAINAMMGGVPAVLADLGSTAAGMGKNYLDNSDGAGPDAGLGPNEVVELGSMGAPPQETGGLPQSDYGGLSEVASIVRQVVAATGGDPQGYEDALGAIAPDLDEGSRNVALEALYNEAANQPPAPGGDIDYSSITGLEPGGPNAPAPTPMPGPRMAMAPKMMGAGGMGGGLGFDDMRTMEPSGPAGGAPGSGFGQMPTFAPSGPPRPMTMAPSGPARPEPTMPMAENDPNEPEPDEDPDDRRPGGAR